MKSQLEKISSTIILVLGAALLAVLSWLAVSSSWINPTLDQPDSQVPVMVSDCIPLHFLIGLLILVVFFFLRKAMKRPSRVFLFSVLAVMAAFGTYWVCCSHTQPQADQLDIFIFAQDMKHGNFSSLQKGQYLGIYRQQLGMVTLLRVFLQIFGYDKFQSFQYFNVLSVLLLTLSGYHIILLLWKNFRAANIYLLLMACCFPLYIYIPYVYGDLLSTGLICCAMWGMLELLEKFRWPLCILTALLTGLAIQFRMNTIIFLIAMEIVLLVRLFSERSKTIIFMLVSFFLGWFLVAQAVSLAYAKYVPEDSKSMPSILWVTMGSQEGYEYNGWYNGYNFHTYEDSGFDPEAASAKAKADLQERIDYFEKNPGYAKDFYMSKFASQWNTPAYQALVMNNSFYAEPSGIADFVYYGPGFHLLDVFMNYYQSFVFIGAFLFALMRLCRKQFDIRQDILLIVCIGGALFSLLWEARSRYVFPYFLIIIPYAAYMTDWICATTEKLLHGHFSGLLRKH